MSLQDKFSRYQGRYCSWSPGLVRKHFPWLASTGTELLGTIIVWVSLRVSAWPVTSMQHAPCTRPFSFFMRLKSVVKSNLPVNALYIVLIVGYWGLLELHNCFIAELEEVSVTIDYGKTMNVPITCKPSRFQQWATVFTRQREALLLFFCFLMISTTEETGKWTFPSCQKSKLNFSER